MLTPEDLRNPARKSGYDHVGYNVSPGQTTPKPYQAVVYGGTRSKAGMAWIGPRRATAEEAAQDYCNYIGRKGVTPTAPLKTAGHAGRRQKLSDDPEVAAALGVLRDAKGQRQGKQGYVYCILETAPGGAMQYVKVGFSTNPAARVAELQTGNPRPLKLHAMKEGTLEDERALQQKYIKENVLQEWFRPTKELLLEFDLDATGKAFGTK